MNSLYLFPHTPDVICVSETWLSADILDSEIYLPNYQLFRLDRNRRGGGVAMYIHSSIPAFLLQATSTLEVLLIQVKFHNKFATIGSFYRPPSFPNDISLLSDLLSSLPPSSLPNLTLTGDFNIDPNHPLHPPTRTFSDLTALLQAILP